jgi:hypothetical protein
LIVVPGLMSWVMAGASVAGQFPPTTDRQRAHKYRTPPAAGQIGCVNSSGPFNSALAGCPILEAGHGGLADAGDEFARGV